MRLLVLMVSLMFFACSSQSESTRCSGPDCDGADVGPDRLIDASVLDQALDMDQAVVLDSGQQPIENFASLEPETFRFDFIADDEMGAATVQVSHAGETPILIEQFAPAFGDAYTLYWTTDEGDVPISGQEVGVLMGQNMMPSSIGLEAGETLRLTLVFKAVPDAVRGGQLVFNAGREIRIPIEHSDDRPEFVLDQEAVDLGNVPAGERRLALVSVRNVGSAVGTLSSVAFTGDDVFSLRIEGRDPEVDTRVLHNPDRDLEPGVGIEKSFEIMIRFMSEQPGVYQGEISILSDAINGDIRLPVRATVGEVTESGDMP
ncbi:MAG: hypothetical protein VYA30_16260 [Myxococcota bacterium]|nr:hypothetical protein [Myxococcota bacterium]